jgi:hypothetical protein
MLRRLVGILLFCSSPSTAGAQSVEATPFATTLRSGFVDDIPVGDNLFLLLETTQSILTTDRFLGGGFYAGQPARVGGFLSSWSQTLFRIGDVSVTDPSGSGMPLLFPSLALWNSVAISTGMLGGDIDAQGLSMSFEPKRPGATWTATVDVATSHFRASGAPGDPPPIVRLDSFDRGTITAAGPLLPGRLGVFVAGSLMRGAQFERAEPTPVDSTLGSAFAHAVFTPTPSDEVRTIAWVQRTSAPFELRLPFGQPGAETVATAGHAQSTWEHRAPGRMPWRFFAGYTRRQQSTDYDSSTGAVFERLVDGPVPLVASMSGASASTVHRWSVGARIGSADRGPAVKRHAFEGGVDADGGGARASSFFAADARELVDALPARVWRFTNPGMPTFRHQAGLRAFVSDNITITQALRLTAGVRYDSVSGSADGAQGRIRWHSVLPRAALRWTFLEAWRPTLFASFTQTAYRLPLDWLAFGDPTAPRADIFRWTGPSPGDLGPLVARAGPGTGGDPAFTAIDAELKRPQGSEFVLALEVRPGPEVRLRVTGMTRNETDLVGLRNVGTPAYDLMSVFDPGADLGSPEDDRLVPVYNRRPETFGQDRFLLTNLDVPDATFEGIEIAAEIDKPRVTMLIGATAGRAETSAANRGFGPLENDQALVGELDAEPNAGTFARGRPFADRAYTAKVAGVYRFPTSTTLGIVARYQDGQPFSRLLVFPALNQGAEAVRAFASGDSRFMFVGTLDVRVQQRFSIGRSRVAVLLDAYNLVGLSNSVEERTTEGPDVRVPTAVQPPRSIHLGVRLSF